jgi:hypothetical protein
MIRYIALVDIGNGLRIAELPDFAVKEYLDRKGLTVVGILPDRTTFLVQ